VTDGLSGDFAVKPRVKVFLRLTHERSTQLNTHLSKPDYRPGDAIQNPQTTGHSDLALRQATEACGLGQLIGEDPHWADTRDPNLCEVG
jgi:hypothetical protein